MYREEGNCSLQPHFKSQGIPIRLCSTSSQLETGHPRKTSFATDKVLGRELLKNPRITTKQLKEAYPTIVHNVAECTIQHRCQKNLKLHLHSPILKPLLTCKMYCSSKFCLEIKRYCHWRLVKGLVEWQVHLPVWCSEDWQAEMSLCIWHSNIHPESWFGVRWAVKWGGEAFMHSECHYEWRLLHWSSSWSHDEFL